MNGIPYRNGQKASPNNFPLLVFNLQDGCIHPIELAYAASDEGLIVEIVGILDEIATVDGDIDKNERE